MIPKYRAWHKELKLMRNVFTMQNIGDDNDLLVMTYGVNGLQCSFGGDDELYMWGISEIELMQWTGLYDRDKKEIYEGDIINVNPHYPEQQLHYVAYTQDVAHFDLLILNGKWKGNKGVYVLAQFASDTYAIVGNTYQNL